MCPTKRLLSAPVWLAAVAAYVVLACGLTWPLPQHLQTHFLGDTSAMSASTSGTSGSSVMSFVEHGHLPLSTDHLFSYTGGLDFALHNYTPLAGLVGVPLMDWLGIVGTFNVILISAMALSGLGVFLLARRLGLAPCVAWSAGALFIASPVLTARGSEHFSLITAAPLPLFIWALLRALDTKRFRDAAPCRRACRDRHLLGRVLWHLLRHGRRVFCRLEIRSGTRAAQRATIRRPCARALDASIVVIAL